MVEQISSTGSLSYKIESHKSFGERLKEMRIRAGLTQEQLAESIDGTDSYISRIERNAYAPPPRERVLTIANRLGITEPTEQAYFLLAAKCAGFDDIEVLVNQGEPSQYTVQELEKRFNLLKEHINILADDVNRLSTGATQSTPIEIYIHPYA